MSSVRPLVLATVSVPKASLVLADRLRERILSNGTQEGTLLPTERELVVQSVLSRASVREALRVLETEGLISTKSGRSGGSVVRRPGPEAIWRSLKLFVRGHGVRFEAVLAQARHRRHRRPGCRGCLPPHAAPCPRSPPGGR